MNSEGSALRWQKGDFLNTLKMPTAIFKKKKKKKKINKKKN